MTRLLLTLLVLGFAVPLTSCGGDAEGATNPPPQETGFTGYQVVEKGLMWDQSGGPDTVQCPSGKQVLGGGYWFGEPDRCTGEGSAPTADRTGWRVDGFCTIGGTPDTAFPVSIYAICADVD